MIRVADALRFEDAGRVFYSGWLRAADIYDAVFVPVTKKSKPPKRRGKSYVEPLEEREGGYQRTASPSRQRKIARYFLQNVRAVIPPVLLSDRGKWKWCPHDNSETVGTIEVLEKAATVDGQHRLGGLRLLATSDGGNPERKVPFIIVSNLSEEEEKQEFLIINNTQKGVPRAHAAFLQRDKWWNAAAWELNESGVFEGRIQGPGGVREPWHLDLKLHSVANAIRDVFRTPAKEADVWGFGEDDDARRDEIPGIVNRYWELISETFADEWSDIEMLPYPEELDPEKGSTRNFEYKLLELTGYLAWMWFLRQIAVNVWNPNSVVLDEERIIQYLTWIREEEEKNPEFGAREGEPEYRKFVDWRKTGKFAGRTGGAGARPILQAMMEVVQKRQSSA